MRHVLRTRVEAVKALAAFFDQLAKRQEPVSASPHLAQLYGQLAPPPVPKDGEEEGTQGLRGTREPVEVIGYLRKRGAKIPSASNVGLEEWVAASETEASSEIEN
jgi:glycerol-3-phosphate O-acyltransferase / dihydroxyacetone phosphate acyltransferase